MQTVRYLANTRIGALATGFRTGDVVRPIWVQDYHGGVSNDEGPFGCPSPEAIFELHNLPDRPCPCFRSMSVGDVIEYKSAIGRRCYAVAPFGFTPISASDYRVRLGSGYPFPTVTN